MVDYSDGAPEDMRSTIYGIDTAIVIVVFASAIFWVCVGVGVWLLL